MTDACPLAARDILGAIGFILTLSWTTLHLFRLHINHKEILAIFPAAKHWAPCWAYHCVIIHSNNQAAMQIINKGTTADEVIMDELCTLFLPSALYNSQLSAVYIEGSRNMIADAVSRLHEHVNLLLFHSILCDCFPHSAVDDLASVDHMSVYSGSFIFSRCSRPTSGLTTA